MKSCVDKVRTGSNTTWSNLRQEEDAILGRDISWSGLPNSGLDTRGCHSLEIPVIGGVNVQSVLQEPILSEFFLLSSLFVMGD